MSVRLSGDNAVCLPVSAEQLLKILTIVCIASGAVSMFLKRTTGGLLIHQKLKTLLSCGEPF